MKKALLGMLAAGALASHAPAAVANHQVWTGGCYFDAVSEPTVTNDSYAGGLGVFAVVQNPDGTPATGTIKCKIQVNGADTGVGGSSSGTGVIVGFPSNGTSFNAADDAHVTLCEDVGHGWWCGPVRGLVEVIHADVWPPVERYVDPIACPVLATLFPPVGDVVLPDPAGVVWDCPPYGS